MQRLLSAWSTVPDLVRTTGGAPPAALARAEEALGRPVPAEVAELYLATDGLELAGGDLVLYTLAGTDEELGVSDASSTIRSWDWGLPEELVVIGSDGSDGVFGIWAVPGARRAVVVQAHVSLDEPAMAVVGTSLAAFLEAWTAYYLPMVNGETEQITGFLDALGVPAALREGESEFDDEHLQALLGWASPDLPDQEPDPYARPVDPEVLTRLASA